MKRKIFLSLMISALIIVFLAGCGTSRGKSAPANSSSGDSGGTIQLSRDVRVEIVDHHGAGLSNRIPAWVMSAIESDIGAFTSMERFQRKVPLVTWGNGQNLDLVRSWYNNFGMQADVSRRISSYVETEFGGKLTGNKDTQENRNFIHEMAVVISQSRFSSLAREMDYWVKLRTTDTRNRTQTEEYRYYVVYSMTEADLKDATDRAMGRISAKNQEQEEMKNDVLDAITRARFNSIQAAN